MSARMLVVRGGGVGLAAVIVLGGAVGLGSYTFFYAEGASYLSNDASACANCHVMSDHFDAWIKSSHHAVATCNDCHAPHGSIAAKLWTKGVNGFNHSVAFTTGRFHEPIRMTQRNRSVTESTCRYCHQDVVHAIDRLPREDQALECIRCHSGVGHP